MAYKISKTDGTTLLSLADGTIDQSATSLTLIGKNYTYFINLIISFHSQNELSQLPQFDR